MAKKRNEGKENFLFTVFGVVFLSDHSVKRYIERIGIRKNMSLKRSMELDLNYKKIKKIINVGQEKHIFTFGKREFIFVKYGSNLVFKTAITHNSHSMNYRIKKMESNKVIS